MRGIVASLGAVIGFLLVWGLGGAWIDAALPNFSDMLHLLIRLFVSLLAAGLVYKLTSKLIG